MTLASNTIIDRIEVLENGVVQVRQAQVITDSGNEIARNFSRWVLSPGENITTQDPKIQAICNAVWTSAVVSAYQAAQAAQKPVGA